MLEGNFDQGKFKLEKPVEMQFLTGDKKISRSTGLSLSVTHCRVSYKSVNL
jgi:hypothetical protein